MLTVPEENNQKPESQGICRSCQQQEEKGDSKVFLKAVSEKKIKLFLHYIHQVQPVQ